MFGLKKYTKIHWEFPRPPQPQFCLLPSSQSKRAQNFSLRFSPNLKVLCVGCGQTDPKCECGQTLILASTWHNLLSAKNAKVSNYIKIRKIVQCYVPYIHAYRILNLKQKAIPLNHSNFCHICFTCSIMFHFAINIHNIFVPHLLKNRD